VALAAFDFLARVVAASIGGELATLDALAVDDRSTGRGVFFKPTRTWSRKISLMRGKMPWLDHWAKASWTVLLGGSRTS
jgi:hypothetical protein